LSIFLEKQKRIKVEREEASLPSSSASEIIIIDDDDDNDGHDDDDGGESKYNFFKLKNSSLNLKFV
jgi:hypothetical protein